MSFDYSQIPATEQECQSFDQLPAGEYNVNIDGCGEDVSPNGYEYVKLKCSITDGQHKDRRISLTFWTGGKFPESAYRQIGSVMFAAVGKGCQLHELANKFIKLKIKYKDGDTYPRFAGCSKYTGAAPVQQQPPAQHQSVFQQPSNDDAPF